MSTRVDVLRFARKHDWGRNAVLNPATGYLEGLENNYLDLQTGSFEQEIVAIPATWTAIKEFGGY